jgi:hypothetical protein
MRCAFISHIIIDIKKFNFFSMFEYLLIFKYSINFFVLLEKFDVNHDNKLNIYYDLFN